MPNAAILSSLFVNSQVQYGSNGKNSGGSLQSSSMSGSNNTTPGPGSSQTSLSESPSDLNEAGQKVYMYNKWREEKWNFPDWLWVEYNDKLESNQNQKYWVTIQEHLNKRFKLSWSVTQIQWEICYLKEQFTQANDKLNKLNRRKQKKQPIFW